MLDPLRVEAFNIPLDRQVSGWMYLLQQAFIDGSICEHHKRYLSQYLKETLLER